MKISVEEYLKAVEIVQQFHKQVALDIKFIDKVHFNRGKKTIREILATKEVSGRLRNILNQNYDLDTYIEDINALDFMRQKNVGRSAFTELEALQGR